VVKFSRAYPASFPSANTATEKQRLYVELLKAHEWINAEVWINAIDWLVWHHDGEYAPVPARIVEACREQSRKVRQAEVNAEVLALPPPEAPPTAADRGVFAWNVAIGRARARKRFALIDAYRKANGLHKHHPAPESVWRGLDEPTETEIRAVSGEAMPPMVVAVHRNHTTADVPGVPSWPGAQLHETRGRAE